MSYSHAIKKHFLKKEVNLFLHGMYNTPPAFGEKSILYSYNTFAKEVFILGIIFKKHYKDRHLQFIILRNISQIN